MARVPNTFEEAVRVRTAAQQAVQSIQGFVLGEGDLANILDKTSVATDISYRIALAASMAKTIADAASTAPKNFADGSLPKAQGPATFGWQLQDGPNGYGYGANTGRAGTGSSARYDSITGNSLATLGSPERLAYEAAVQYGIGWATQYSGLLQLGPAAIQALADAHLQQRNYEHMTKLFGLTPKEVVSAAKKAKKAGIDLPAADDEAANIYNQLPADERPGFSQSQKRFLPHLDEPPAKEREKQDLERLRQRYPELAPHIDRLHNLYHLKDTKLNAVQKQTAAKKERTVERRAAAAKTVAMKDDALDVFNAELAGAAPSITPVEQTKREATKEPPSNANKPVKQAAANPPKASNPKPA